MSGRAEGKAIGWTNGHVTLLHSSKTAASLEQVCENSGVTLRVSTSIEYDGYMTFDCALEAQHDLSIASLKLEIPLQTRNATLCFAQAVYAELPKIPMSVSHSGAVKSDLDFRFSPNIWLGNEDRGLCWQAESDEHWHCADKQKAIEILPRDQTTTFRANLISLPTQLAANQVLHYKFALLATPVKPVLRDSWDLRIVKPAVEISNCPT